MAIQVTCPCGKKFRMPDMAAGERINCRDCGVELVIPPRNSTIRLVAVKTVEKRCSCGARIKMSITMAGQRVPCAQCGQQIQL